MPAPPLSSLRHEYEELFSSCVITKPVAVQEIVDDIVAHQDRYQTVEGRTGVPWPVIGAIHSLECSLKFDRHLHNGDPLAHKTVHDPPNRPPHWDGTGTWEDSAVDALAVDSLSSWHDWSVAGTLYKLESFNGFGSRAHGIHTPYLWSFSNHYTMGKFVADHVYSPTAVSKQCGTAVLLRRMVEMGQFEFADQPVPAPVVSPLVRFSAVRSAIAQEVEFARNLQSWLNSYPGIHVSVDGVPGPITSKAFKTVTGHYLLGDTRE